MFNTNKFKNYWFQTATPTFLIDLVKKQQVAVEDFEGYKAGEAIFESFDLDRLHTASLLFQTGYLTIADYKNRRYTLNYPNFEVKESFLIHLLAEYSGTPPPDAEPLYLDMLDYLNEMKIDAFSRALTSLFAGIPAVLHLPYERYYHSLSYLVLALLGAEIDLETNTDKGRIDAVLKLKDKIYIIEFKLDSINDALKQIREKRYCEKYIRDGRKIILLAVGGFREKSISVIHEIL